MTRADVRRHLIETLDETQRRIGSALVPLEESTCPMEHIPGFDSLLALETTVALEQRLGVDDLGISLFRDPRAKRLRNVGEVVDCLCATLKIAESKDEQ